jgi:hypothetical protein
MICAAPDCTNEGVDLVELGVKINLHTVQIEAEFALCGEHGALVTAIMADVEPQEFPTFWMGVRGIQTT